MGWIKILCNRLETSCSSLRKIIQREGEWIENEWKCFDADRADVL